MEQLYLFSGLLGHLNKETNNQNYTIIFSASVS